MLESVERLVWNFPATIPENGKDVFVEFQDKENCIIEHSSGRFVKELGEYGQIVTVHETGVDYEDVIRWVYLAPLVRTIEENKIDTIKIGEVFPYYSKISFVKFCGMDVEGMYVFIRCDKDGFIIEPEQEDIDDSLLTVWLNRREANEMLLLM